MDVRIVEDEAVQVLVRVKQLRGTGFIERGQPKW